MFRAQFVPCGQNCSLPPASTISSTWSPTASRAVRTSSSSNVGVAPAERPPAQLDRLEAALDHALERPPQPVRLVEEDRAVGLDRVAVVAAQQPRDGLPAGLAHQVPQGDVDAADGVLDRSRRGPARSSTGGASR